MRIALSIILGLLLTLQLSALPVVKTGALPAWLYTTHPDLNRKPAADAIGNGYYYSLIDAQTNLSAKTKYTHYIIDITNESGVQNASEVSVTFAPEFQQVVFHHIDVLRDGAVLRQLNLANIKTVQEEKEAGEFEYNGLKRAFLTLRDIRKGDKIDVAYSVIGFNPVFGNKYSDDFVFSNSTAVCNYYKSIITSADRPLHILTENKAPKPTEKHIGNTLVYTWENPSLVTDESETNTPSWYDNSPTIFVTEYSNWQEVVDWGLNTFSHYQFPLPAGLHEKIAAWHTRTNGNKDLFANIANRFVQNDIRYLGLEIGVNTHRPHAPSDVFTQRFGDCKDKALLLAMILREEGIPASVALVSTDTRSQLINTAPSPRDFDHAIVAIRRDNGQYIYIDPTNSGQRGELTDLYLPDYGYALVLADGETRLEPVAPGRINDYTVTEHLDAKFYDSSRFTVTSIYAGGAADEIRGIYAETSLRDIEEQYRKYYTEIFEGIRASKPITWTDDSLKNELTVHEYYAIPHLWNTDKAGKKYFDFTAGLLDKAFPDPDKASGNAPLALTYPHNIRYTFYISLPEDWGFDPTELHLKNSAYQFDFTPTVSGSNIVLHYDLKTFSDHIAPEDIRQYKQDYEEIMGRVSIQLYKTQNSESSRSEEAAPAKKGTHTSTALPADWKVCWPAIWLTFFFSLFFSRLFVWLNSRSEETLYAPGSGYPLGGWLILLGISIGGGILIEVYQLFRDSYYSNDTWTAIGNAGGSRLQYFHMAQLAIRLSFIAGGAAVGYWFLQRRDIFPRMFLWYACLLLSGQALLFVLLAFMPDHSNILGAYKTELLRSLLRSGVYSAIWVTFILRSGQVKSTFLEPYRERIR